VSRPCDLNFPAGHVAAKLVWSHILEVDLRDGCTRTGGSNAVAYADGNEVRIPDGSRTQYVVVWMERLVTPTGCVACKLDGRTSSSRRSPLFHRYQRTRPSTRRKLGAGVLSDSESGGGCLVSNGV
jgi:hypothetical protein